MSLFQRLSIKTRLFGTVGLVLLMLVVIAAVTLQTGRRVNTEVEQLVQSEFRKFELIAQIDAATRSNARNTLQLFLVNEDRRAPIRANMGELREKINAWLKELDTLIHSPKGRALYEELVRERTAYVKAFSEASQLLSKNQDSEARQILEEKVLPQIERLQAPITQLVALQKDLALNRSETIKSGLSTQSALILTFGVLALLIGLYLSYRLIRSILLPLQLAHTVTREIGGGNLAFKFEVEGHDELAQMLVSLHQMQEHLAHVMMRIQESTNSVASASSEIASANIDLSARTESQASALQQTAATMEEINSTLQSNAATTRQATTTTQDATRVAKEVGGLVERLVDTMKDIHESSSRIHDIINVIDSIAFQTNILALNAAVEAARAGEQGRGFAVVAAEVRALAHRSAKAAQEIKQIITENVEKMDAGNAVAQQAGSAVGTVVTAIENVNTTVAEINGATHEQSLGVAQIEQAISQIDESTQQNAALVEETAAATQNLDSQVQALKGQINRFRIGGRALTGFDSDTAHPAALISGGTR